MQRAAPAASTHAVRRSDVDARARIRKASISPPKRAPSAVARPGAPRQRPVDQVQHEGGGGERHKESDRHVVRERVHRQGGDADREGGPGQRHPGRRSQRFIRTAGEAAGERRRDRHRAGGADGQSGDADAGRRLQDGEQERLGEQAGRRTRPPGSFPGHRSMNRGERAQQHFAGIGAFGEPRAPPPVVARVGHEARALESPTNTGAMTSCNSSTGRRPNWGATPPPSDHEPLHAAARSSLSRRIRARAAIDDRRHQRAARRRRTRARGVASLSVASGEE
jgi:hypothetical protein